MSHRPHRPSRRLGQNFLKDLGVAHDIVSAAGLQKTDSVLEPGPGHGVLTRLLEPKAGQVIAVEKDRHLAAELRKEFLPSSSVQIIEGDVLKVHLPPFNRVVGTPPYNISSKLVLLLQASRFEECHLVFQREFADRLMAQPGTENYGRLSVTAQRKMTLTSLMEVSRESFSPKPKVDSVLLRFQPRPYRTDVDETILSDLVRGIFTQRRRLIRGALSHYLKLKLGRDQARKIVQSLDLPDSRVYQQSIGELEELAIRLKSLLPHESNTAARIY